MLLQDRYHNLPANSIQIIHYLKRHHWIIASNTVWCKILEGEYFGGFGGFASYCQKFTFKVSTLNNNAISVTAQPPKYHHPNVFSSFICQKLAPPKFFAIRYII